MKKNLLAILLTLILIFFVAGCASETSSGSATQTEGYTATQDIATVDTDEAHSETDSEVTVSNVTVVSAHKGGEASASDTTASVSAGLVTKDYAKSVALTHAGASAEKITDYEIDLDRENGTLIYEITFDFSGYEYDYTINAADGVIINSYKEKDEESPPKPSTNNTASLISKSEAKTIALNHAKVKASDIRDYEIELDRDSKVTTYDISFKSGKYEYEYEISASNGKILNAEKDFDD